MIHVVRPGLLTTVQDCGRWGSQARGVPVSGAMDPWSHRAANALVGNPAGAATLEVTMTGPELDFEDGRLVAVVGADFDLSVDERPLSRDAVVAISAGSRLRFGIRRTGARAYLAVGGGFAVPLVFGSRSTHLATGMGGLNGRALVAGDRLPLGDPPKLARDWASKQRIGIVHDERSMPARIRVLLGPNLESFAADAVHVLQGAPYRVASHSDRMGYRLEGADLTHQRGGDIISEATPLGTVQVPASGQPILLMADRPTTGGYPKIATVITADIPIAAQLGPGDALVFVACSIADAAAALIARERPLMALEARAAS